MQVKQSKVQIEVLNPLGNTVDITSYSQNIEVKYSIFNPYSSLIFIFNSPNGYMLSTNDILKVTTLVTGNVTQSVIKYYKIFSIRSDNKATFDKNKISLIIDALDIHGNQLYRYMKSGHYNGTIDVVLKKYVTDMLNFQEISTSSYPISIDCDVSSVQFENMTVRQKAIDEIKLLMAYDTDYFMFMSYKSLNFKKFDIFVKQLKITPPSLIINHQKQNQTSNVKFNYTYNFIESYNHGIFGYNYFEWINNTMISNFGIQPNTSDAHFPTTVNRFQQNSIFDTGNIMTMVIPQIFDIGDIIEYTGDSQTQRWNGKYIIIDASHIYSENNFQLIYNCWKF